MNEIDTITKYIPQQHKLKIFILIILLLVGVTLEGLSFAIFIPALEMILNDNSLYIEKFYINKFIEFDKLNFENQIIFFLTIITIIFFCKNSYLLFINWYKNKIFKEINAINSVKLFKYYLDLEWEKLIQKNSSEIIRNIQSEIQKITITIGAFLDLITEILIFSVILILLLIWNPKIVIFLISFFGVISYFFLIIIKKRINKWAKEIQNNETAFFKNIKEAIGSLKEIRILGKKNIFIDELKEKIVQAQNSRLKYETTQHSPRFFLEFCSVLVISLITIYLININIDKSQILVTLGLIGVALFRIMPATSRIVKNINDIRFGMNSVRVIHKETSFDIPNKISSNTLEKVSFNNHIELKNINFSYGNKKEIFRDLNLKIEKNSTIGIIGSSGSGKTTLIDILLGLLSVKNGELKIDSQIIDKNNLKSYQTMFGYIPQVFYLFDNTIKHNIQIKEDEKNSFKENDEKILNILHKLKLEKILTENGIHNIIGENAIRISGGQRQRLGIARVLFHDREVLIFDEATNALDNQTEKEIFNHIYSLKGKKTIIISTHNPQMLDQCDKVYKIENNNLSQVTILKN